ncbi:hypothetical protein CHS0354_042742 [Potamilus streckersoni]|uniref:Uncharacterized protein n=1 Tax=Potamilus streckersoni TaxID=2493646 RepID=A0AAE0S9V7_9BIVA|nr:hypothetical protein CHS0354_042742 [Potamilus streckersoni]
MEEYDTGSSQGFSQHTNNQQYSRESNVDELLSSFNKGYHQAKAQQIIRLLNDQDCLNTRFKECDLRESSDSGDSDFNDSLSEASVKEAEKQLNQKLALHKQIGGRSKTSMGFYIEYDEHSQSLKTNESKMAERESEFDTRYNRPKSSYVRRRGLYVSKDESNIENTEITDDIIETSAVKRISKSARPRSSYGTRNAEGCKRKIAHAEANFNHDKEGLVYPTKEDLVSSNDYDRYASTRTTPVPQLRRERTTIRGFCDEGQQIREPSTPLSSMDTRDSVIVTELTPMKMKAVDISPHQVKHTNSPELGSFTARPRNPESIPSRPVSRRSGERVIPHIDHTDPRTMRQTGSERPRTRRLQRRYMAQQNINSSPSSRPTSESVILARQRTEYNMERAKGSARPKSEKMLINSTNKSVISVDSTPMKGPTTSVTKTKSGESQSSHVQTTAYRGFGEPARQNPSNAGARRSELSLPRPGNNVILGGRRPLTLMKLPPLDMVAKKTDKNLQLAHETCV